MYLSTPRFTIRHVLSIHADSRISMDNRKVFIAVMYTSTTSQFRILQYFEIFCIQSTSFYPCIRSRIRRVIAWILLSHGATINSISKGSYRNDVQAKSGPQKNRTLTRKQPQQTNRYRCIQIGYSAYRGTVA